MCGRYELANPHAIYEHFGIHPTPLSFTLTANSNVSPTQQVPVLLADGTLTQMQWGLVPAWARRAKMSTKAPMSKPLINARAETVASKPSFRGALRYRRCIIPASGFYEWKATPSGKVPHVFRVRETEMFGFAGLYEDGGDSVDGERGSEEQHGAALPTCAIITTQANALVAPIHDRMPVIFQCNDDEQRWLDPDLVEAEQVIELLRPYPAAMMLAAPIAPAVVRQR